MKRHLFKFFHKYRLKRFSALAFCSVIILICATFYGTYSVICEVGFMLGAVPVPIAPQQNAPYELQKTPPYTVVVDPGHGGCNTGAKGIINETQLIDKTAQELFLLLQNDTNYKPVLTRTESEEPKTAMRSQIATDNKASLLISIHGNCDKSTSQSHGFECFAMPPGRLYHAQSMQFAQRITNGMALAVHKLRGENGIKFTYYNGKQKRMVDSTDTKVRTQKSFGILEKTYCPAVLVEQCFISNRSDVNTWASPDGCKLAAKIYYTAICEYFKTPPFNEKTVTTQPSTTLKEGVFG